MGFNDLPRQRYAPASLYRSSFGLTRFRSDSVKVHRATTSSDACSREMAAATRDADFARDRQFLSRTIVSSFESTPFTAANAKRCRLANDSSFNQLENSLLQASVTRQPSRPWHTLAPNCCLKGLIANEFFQFFTRPCRVWVIKILVRRELRAWNVSCVLEYAN